MRGKQQNEEVVVQQQESSMKSKSSSSTSKKEMGGKKESGRRPASAPAQPTQDPSRFVVFPECNVCENELVVTNPEAVLWLGVGEETTTTCGALDLMGRNGLIEPTLCLDYQDADETKLLCECQDPTGRPRTFELSEFALMSPTPIRNELEVIKATEVYLSIYFRGRDSDFESIQLFELDNISVDGIVSNSDRRRYLQNIDYYLALSGIALYQFDTTRSSYQVQEIEEDALSELDSFQSFLTYVLGNEEAPRISTIVVGDSVPRTPSTPQPQEPSTEEPTILMSPRPTPMNSAAPISAAPITAPTPSPTKSSERPSAYPSLVPSIVPTTNPSVPPTQNSLPSSPPSRLFDTTNPTTSLQPSMHPSAVPSREPTTVPSRIPTSSPSTQSPSLSPSTSHSPSERRTSSPTSFCDTCDPRTQTCVKCDKNETCVRKCVCAPGFFTPDGFNCVDINECMSETDDCDDNASCFNTFGSYKCTCNDGYKGDGRTCTET
eukprot:CAMPEP_0194230660 /NCGR_PEP_ID=MMETSP0156-20130528/44527_1 /TAXON_ID=33649 /ORGANISM="Thalassionema nitzschioides, Strain L26-B" /LENGTH=491 /DNA_ID=CAMNT_0038963253 /DNA_START=121 /DNA_END=1596 /DNA_ORIENTATION=-